MSAQPSGPSEYPSEYYVVGGNLPPDAPSYAERQADQELYDAIRAGQFCYVLNSRQMGKSSLRVRTMQRLQAEGFACAEIDITRIGSDDITIDQWYAGIIRNLVSSFGFTDRFNLRAWLKEQEYLSPVQRLSEFIETVLLVQVPQAIAIFVDEIDSVVSLQKRFSLDDFFALIRACYNQRSDKPAYQRLTFTLLGVATPSDLIRDKTRTPFNIGQAIDLCGLTFAEARSLLPGIATRAEQPEAVLQAVLDWTAGQPFLTQKICRLIHHAEAPVTTGDEAAWVEQLVRSRIIENWESQDVPEHLKTIRDRILRNEKLAGRLLGLYQQILQQGSVPADDGDDQMEFRLSGLVVKRQGVLTVYNRVYREVFNGDWAQQTLASLRSYSEALNGWLASERGEQSWLLRGSVLEQALGWAKGKSLSPQDSDFLYASQEFARQETQKELQAERQANAILKDAEQRARRRIRSSLVGLVVISAVAAMIGTWAVRAGANLQRTEQQMEALTREKQQVEKDSQAAQANRQQAEAQTREARKDADRAQQNQKKANQKASKAQAQAQQAQVIAAQAKVAATAAVATAETARQEKQGAIKERNRVRKGINLERQGAGLSRFPVEEYRQIDKLIAAIQVVQALKAQLPNKSLPKNLKDYPAVSPLLVLRTAVNTVTERNQFLGRDPSFSPDGKQVLTTSDDGSRLYDRSGKELAKFPGRDPRFSPNGKQVLTFLADGIRLYDLRGKELAKFPGRSPSFSPDGKQVLTDSDDGIRLYDLRGKELVKFPGRSPRFSPDSKQVLTDSDDGIRLYDLRGKELAKFQGSLPSFSPDGKQVLTDSDDGIRLYDRNGKELVKFLGSFPSFSPDGKQVLTSSSNGNRLYDLRGNKLAEFPGSDPRFSPDGKQLLTDSDDGWHLYDLIRGKELAKFQESDLDYKPPRFSPDSKQVLHDSDDGSRLYDLSGKELARFQGNSPSFSPDGKQVLIASGDGSRLYDLPQNLSLRLQNANTASSPDGKHVLTDSDDVSRLYDLRGKELTKFLGRSPRFSPDGKHVLTFSDNDSRLYDLRGKELANFPGGFTDFSPDGKQVLNYLPPGLWLYDLRGKELANFRGRSLHLSPDGKQVLIGLIDGSRLYDLNGKELANFLGSDPRLSPDGKHVLTFSTAGWRLYDLSGKELAKLQRSRPRFSPNGKQVLTDSADGIRLYDLNGKELAKFPGSFLSFSPDGKQVLTDSDDGSRLYDLRGKELANFPGRYPRFSPDGRWILTTSPTEDISRIYDRQGNLLAEFVGSTFTNNRAYQKLSLGFTQDGKQLLTLTNDGTLRAWPIDQGLEQDKGMNDLLMRGCHWLKDYLTSHPEELKKLPVCQEIYGQS